MISKTFRRVRAIAEDREADFIICTGDIFHHWSNPPELLNFAIDKFRFLNQLGPVYSIAGNHDLPEHRYDQIHRSSYWNLCQAGVINDLNGPLCILDEGISRSVNLWGFPCGSKVTPRKTTKGVNIAVVHDYCWKFGHSFPGAPEDKRVQSHRERLQGFTCAVFGDNHKGFLDTGTNNTPQMPILNVGGFIRRNSDECEYEPQIGLLHADGSLSTELLKVPAQWDIKTYPAGVAEDESLLAEEVVDMMRDLKHEHIDFGDAVRNFIRKRKVSKNVAEILLKSIQ